MIAPDVQELAARLQQQLGLAVVCGQVTLNFNNGDLQSVETKTFVRVKAHKAADNRRHGE